MRWKLLNQGDEAMEGQYNSLSSFVSDIFYNKRLKNKTMSNSVYVLPVRKQPNRPTFKSRTAIFQIVNLDQPVYFDSISW